jgi:hypothetical protein
MIKKPVRKEEIVRARLPKELTTIQSIVILIPYFAKI